MTERIELPGGGTGFAVGGGALWVTDPLGGTVLRVRSGARPGFETIQLGAGVAGIVADRRGAWVANVETDTVTRLDADTGRVALVTPVAFPYSLAIGTEGVWVTSQAPALRACGGLVYEGTGRPDVEIVSDLPLQAQAADGLAVRRAVESIKLVLAQRGFRAGRHRVAYRSCDNSTATAGSWDYGRCLANAKGYAGQAQIVGIVGTLNSECAGVELPVTNRTPHGPLPMISGWNTYSALTRAPPDRERLSYPSGERHYFRVVAEDHAQAAAGGMLARRLGARRVVALHSLDETGTSNVRAFATSARRLGLEVADVRRYLPGTDLDALARWIRRRRAEAVYIGARFNERGAELIRALRARLGSGFPLIATDVFLGAPDLVAGAGDAARGVYYTAAGLPDERLPPAGRRFLQALDARRPPEPDVWPPASHGAAAAEALLDAIARSDGTRRGVLAALHELHSDHGILGPLAFDRRGDTTNRAIAIWRVAGDPRKNITCAPALRGLALDRILRPSARLLQDPSSAR